MWRLFHILCIVAIMAAGTGLSPIIARAQALPASAAGAPLKTVADRIATLEPHWTLLKPDGEGPFPVVFLLHGCGGGGPFLGRYGEAAVQAGAAALIVDSLKPRGISRAGAYATVCTGARLRGTERAGDLYAAIAWAKRQPWADPARLAVAGWSHGGWTALDSLVLKPGADMESATRLSDLSGEPMAGVQALFLAYPYCGMLCSASQRSLRLRPKITAVLAGKDRVVSTRQAADALEKIRRRGASVRVVVLEGATHAFDEPEARDVRNRYDPALTATSTTLFTQMIEGLRGAPPAADDALEAEG